MDKKTIWIVCQYAGSKYHGMNYRPYYLGKEFLKNNYNVYIISGSYSHQYLKIPNISGRFTVEKIDGINYLWVKLPKYHKSKSLGRAFCMLVFMLKLFRLKVKALPKPDTIIVSSPSPLPILNAYMWAKKFKTKLIFEVRDIWPLTLMELGNYSRYNPFVFFMQWFENFAYRRADHVVSVLPEAKDHMVAHGLHEDKFNYIPNGIDFEEMSGQEALDNSMISNIPRKKFIIGYTGTLGIANALDHFIDAARKIKDNSNIYFIIVGNGGEKEQLMNRSSSLNTVLFFDAVKKTQVQALLDLFNVCFISLKKERLFRFGVSPNKLFDYMYAGKPIIYAVDSGNDPVKEAKCGISIEAENTDAVVEAVLQFYRMTSNERDTLGKNGKNYVIKNHNYKYLAGRYIDLFNR